jgi:hypothetical protein
MCPPLAWIHSLKRSPSAHGRSAARTAAVVMVTGLVAVVVALLDRRAVPFAKERLQYNKLPLDLNVLQLQGN